jgi:PTS system cellobiose-specific IIB component
MKRILLCCSSGMSTSLLVNKMRKVAEEHKLPVEINAVGLDRFETEVKNYDVTLLGPQVKFKLDEFKPIAEANGKKIDVIDTRDYGTMDGKRVLSQAIKLIKENN